MKGKARIIEADRSQPSWEVIDLEAWLPADHLARTVWAFTGTLDLSPLYAIERLKNIVISRVARSTLNAE